MRRKDARRFRHPGKRSAGGVMDGRQAQARSADDDDAAERVAVGEVGVLLKEELSPPGDAGGGDDPSMVAQLNER